MFAQNNIQVVDVVAMGMLELQNHGASKEDITPLFRLFKIMFKARNGGNWQNDELFQQLLLEGFRAQNRMRVDKTLLKVLLD